MHINYILYLLNLFTDSRSNKYSSKIEDTRHIHATYILLQIKYNNIYIVLKRKFILTHNYNCYNSYVLRKSLHQTHILLNNGTEDLTIPFTNELQES